MVAQVTVYGTFERDILPEVKTGSQRGRRDSRCPPFFRFPLFTIVAPLAFFGLLYCTFSCLAQDLCFEDASSPVNGENAVGHNFPEQDSSSTALPSGISSQRSFTA